MQLPDTATTDVLPRAVAFTGAALAWSWLPWGVVAAMGGDPLGSPAATALWVLGGLGPAVATVALIWRHDGRAGLSRLWASLRRWRLGHLGWLLLVPVAVAALAIVILVVSGRAALAPAVGPTLLLVPLFLLSGVVLGGLEEVGWRGYLQPLLQVRYRPLPAALAVALVWTLWHAPLFLLEGTRQAATSTATFTLGAVGLSVLFAWVWNSSGGNLLLLVLLHAAVNGGYTTAVQGLSPQVDEAAFTTVTALLAGLLALGLLLRVGPDLGVRGVRGQPDRPL